VATVALLMVQTTAQAALTPYFLLSLLRVAVVVDLLEQM
jgi:hypothetical protein